MAKVLVTGGAGFIGSHLSEALLARGDEVTIIDDLSTGRIENIEHLRSRAKFRFAIETVMNETVMDRLVSECDIVYHLAAAVGVDLIVGRPVEVIETNVLGAHIVFKIANRYKKKVVLSSSSEIYGKSEDVPFREDADRVLGPTTRSRWSYADSKAMDEFLALAYHKERQLPVVIVRLFNTVGPRQTGRYGMVVPRLVEQALCGRPMTVYGDGRQSRCFAYVTDIVGAILNLADHPDALGEVFNLGSTEEVTIEELALRIKERTGSESSIVYVPYDRAYEVGFEDMRRRVPDISKARDLIGYSPAVGLDEILDRIIAYFRA